MKLNILCHQCMIVMVLSWYCSYLHVKYSLYVFNMNEIMLKKKSWGMASGYICANVVSKSYQNCIRIDIKMFAAHHTTDIVIRGILFVSSRFTSIHSSSQSDNQANINTLFYVKMTFLKLFITFCYNKEP